jgi:hypothetical protein
VKKVPKNWATSVLNKLPKVNNNPIGENSPNLVTLADSVANSSFPKSINLLAAKKTFIKSIDDFSAIHST